MALYMDPGSARVRSFIQPQPHSLILNTSPPIRFKITFNSSSRVKDTNYMPIYLYVTSVCSVHLHGPFTYEEGREYYASCDITQIITWQATERPRIGEHDLRSMLISLSFDINAYRSGASPLRAELIKNRLYELKALGKA